MVYTYLQVVTLFIETLIRLIKSFFSTQSQRYDSKKYKLYLNYLSLSFIVSSIISTLLVTMPLY